MTQEEYFKDRIDDQIDWYSKRAVLNKKLYHLLKVCEIVFSVTIPFLTGYINQNSVIKYIIGVLGLCVAVLAGLIVLYKFQEKWIEYRTAAEGLRHEKFMFLTQSGPYKNDNSLSSLAERVEYSISKENSNWNQMVSKKERTQETDAPKTTP